MENRKNEIVRYEALKDTPNFERSFELHKKLTLIKLEDTDEPFNSRTIVAINNQIMNHTIIDSKTGMLYFRVEGIHNILRTSRGIARNLVYHGASPELAASSTISHNDKDYVSQPSLMAMIDYSTNLSKGTKIRYINYVNTSIKMFKSFEYLKNLKDKILSHTMYSRSLMKAKKIKADKIEKCQFTNKVFKSLKEVEFAHIDAVAYKPFLAGDLKNGVIVLKEIHETMTKQDINDFVAMYKFCEENNYDLKWAEKVDW
ncbi:MAG: hypothetical protein ATN31_06865 [Candidatus Epulonipiscioides saccharophilum]|nr:MAG: hypothetical protein ATN31_06865 [Epulopiscium sp. AS2M-Bin001]